MRNKNSIRYQYPYSQLYPQTSVGVNDFKNIVIYGTLGAGVTTGLFFLVRSLIKKAQLNSTEKNSATEGDPAMYAKHIKYAFDNDGYWFGWGTDESLLLQTMRAIPSRSMYNKVQNAYQTMYGSNLNADMESELSAEDYDKVVTILNLKK